MEGDDDLDSFYKRKLYDPNESDGSAWEGQRKDIVTLLVRFELFVENINNLCILEMWT